MAVKHISLAPEPLKAASDLCQIPIRDSHDAHSSSYTLSVHRFNTHISGLHTEIDFGILTVNKHIVI